MSMLGYDTSLNYLLAGQPDLGHPLLAVLLLDLYFVQVRVLHVHGLAADQASQTLVIPS